MDDQKIAGFPERFDLSREIWSNPKSFAAAVRSDVSVVSAMAG